MYPRKCTKMYREKCTWENVPRKWTLKFSHLTVQRVRWRERRVSVTHCSFFLQWCRPSERVFCRRPHVSRCASSCTSAVPALVGTEVTRMACRAAGREAWPAWGWKSTHVADAVGKGDTHGEASQDTGTAGGSCCRFHMCDRRTMLLWDKSEAVRVSSRSGSKIKIDENKCLSLVKLQ